MKLTCDYQNLLARRAVSHVVLMLRAWRPSVRPSVCL